MIFINESSSNLSSEIDRLIDKKLRTHRQDVFSSFKDYIKYDPDFIAFRNLTTEHYSKELDKCLNLKLESGCTQINTAIDTKINTLVATQPVDLMVTKIKKDIDPEIKSNETLGFINLALSITNGVMLGYLLLKKN
jgi:hypothetical protein